MATIKKTSFRTSQFGGAAYGNKSTLPFKLETDANGAAKDSNSSAAIGNGDKVILGTLPAGMTLQDYQATVSNAFTALVTAKIGFEYVDGVDSTSVPQDDDYFGTGVTLHTAGLYRKTTSTAPVTLPKDAYLILTTAGAANAEAGRVDIFVEGELTGQP